MYIKNDCDIDDNDEYDFRKLVENNYSLNANSYNRILRLFNDIEL
jgi:hypothetical protein